jgi:hypothetical protein
MSTRSERSVTSRPIGDPREARSAKRKIQNAEWQLSDERLDEALRQTFPASDPLSITRNVRDS